MKVRLAIAAVLTVPTLMSATAPTEARTYTENTPGCISHKEFINFERGTMSQVEARNGVTGLGKTIVWSNSGDHVVRQYPWCGHPVSDFVQVSYDKNVAGQYMANYVSEWDLP